MYNRFEKILFGLIATVAIVLTILIFYKSNSVQPLNIQSTRTIPTDEQPTLGDGPIQMVVLEDLKCINCKVFNEHYFPIIKQKYIDTHIASYTMIPLAFIQGSPPAANAAYCLNEQSTTRFFNFVDFVYRNQPDERLDWATEDNLLAMAAHAGPADQAELLTCMRHQRYFQKLKQNLSQASEIMEHVSTPTLFINGERVYPLSIDNIDALVAQEQRLQGN